MGPTATPAAGSVAALSLLPVSVLAALLLSGCASGGARVGAAGAEGTGALPPPPATGGPPSLYVAYPDSLQRIAVSDSNFLFGTAGSGEVGLAVNGHPVTVEPNGAFLAWLPVPEPARGDTAVYRLVATAAGAADTLEWPVLLPPSALPEPEGLWLDTTALRDLPERWVLPREPIEVTLRGAPGMRGWLEVARQSPRRPLVEAAPGRYRAELRTGHRWGGARGHEDGREDAGASEAGRERRAAVDALRDAARRRVGVGAGDTTRAIPLRAVLTDGRDTVRTAGSLPLRVLDPRRLPAARLLEAPDTVHGPAGVVVGRSTPYGPYAWRFPEGTLAAVDGRDGDRFRLRLRPGLVAWADSADARVGQGPWIVPPWQVPTGVVGAVSVRADPEGLRLAVPASRRLPAELRVTGPRTLELVLHGGLGSAERTAYGPEEPLLEALEWSQEAGPAWRLRVRLARPVWGWDLDWEGFGGRRGADGGGTGATGEAAPGDRAGAGLGASAAADEDPGGILLLRIRRPPVIDGDRPLRGRTVAVDAGHPPVGAEGPTGLTEAEANLAVARRLAELLRREGARPFLVRDDSLPVGLNERRARARAAGAELFVSLHNNALPDGLRPFGREGTSTYYHHPPSLPLARAVQRGMLRTMGLRDLGVVRANLSVVRQSWMPAVLTEGAFMMFPRHEAALRTPAFRDAYARGVLEGLRDFLAGWDRDRPDEER